MLAQTVLIEFVVRAMGLALLLTGSVLWLLVFFRYRSAQYPRWSWSPRAWTRRVDPKEIRTWYKDGGLQMQRIGSILLGLGLAMFYMFDFITL